MTNAKDATMGSLLTLAGGLCRVAGRSVPVGTPVWERDDWDILCIMDGCRVDAFDAVATEYDFLAGGTSMYSVGSMSPEWITNTFDREQFAEEMSKTAYLSGNPFTSKAGMDAWPDLPLDADGFAVLDETWQTAWEAEDDQHGISTIPPRALTDRAIDVWRRREELGVEKLIIHYMQPHSPFRSRPEWFATNRDLDAFGEPTKEQNATPESQILGDIWLRLRDGEVSREAVWRAYLDNLRWVLDDVALLRRNADAQIAVSSDHGQGMGESGIWSHPPRVIEPAIRKVPWDSFRGTDTELYEPAVDESPSTSTMQEKLQALGYRE